VLNKIDNFVQKLKDEVENQTGKLKRALKMKVNISRQKNIYLV
jgi:hypothetical protein